MNKDKLMRVDNEIFAQIVNDLKKDFSKRGVELSDRQATKLLGLKLKNKEYIL